jgi:hypothetical protein
MTASTKTRSGMGLTEGLAFKLAALFCGVFFAVFVGLWIYDLLGSFSESRSAEAAVVQQQSPIVIDPKMQSDLAQVLAFDSTANAEIVKDPFFDRTGISAGAGLRSSGTAQTASAGTGSSGPGGSTSRFGSGGSGSLGVSPNVPSTTDARLKDWEERQRLGEMVGPEWELYSIDDLVPVGFTSGGNAPDEVTLYSKSTCRTFSIKAGTRLYDGWLNTFNTDFAMFMWGGGQRSVTKSFARPTVLCTQSATTEPPPAAGTDKNE